MDFFFILLFFGSILSSFWCHFSDFLRIGGICENVGFTIVKQMVFEGLGGPGSLLFSDVFQVLFLGTTFSVFLCIFYVFWCPWAP